MKYYIIDDYTVKVGQSPQENDDLVSNSPLNSIWLHLQKFSSPHGVILWEEPTPEPTLHIIIQAAEKVKENSGKRCRNLKNIGIEYTMLSNVHSTTTPGLVIVSKYKIVKV